MAYVDQEYYDNEYMGLPTESPEEFKRMAKRASEVVDQLTHYRIRSLDDLAEPTKKKIKQAVCAQIEFYVLNGGYDETIQLGDMQNVRIGSFSYSRGTGRESSDSTFSNTVGSNVVEHLKPTGLLYSGIGVQHGY